KTPWGDYAFMPHIVSNRGPLASRHIESLPDFYLDSSYGIAFDPTGDKVEVHGINGENNTSVEEIVDYLFTLVGDWN
ncbi:MAG: hypothetical protein JW829_10260, partial [Pirellulales bacterium]|nr:hypothetical protein [Pirellulales bacterium]